MYSSEDLERFYFQPFERMLNAEENQLVHDSFFNELNCKEEINQFIEKAQNEIIQLNTRINILVKGHSFEINDDKLKKAKLEEPLDDHGQSCEYRFLRPLMD